MVQSVKAAPPNSLILISDLAGGEIPVSMQGALIAATDSCIVVGCQSDADGDTEFTLGEAFDVDPGSVPTFIGQLMTPNRRITLRTVTGETLLEMPVLHEKTNVRIWANDPNEPDQLIVGIR